MSNEVRDLLDALHEGTVTLDEVAQRFRARKWPSRDERQPSSFRELAAAELEDPDPYIPGSYDDVVAAYDLGRLTDPQYAVLAEAIAEAQRAGETGAE
jgi:hypothetical protein